MATALDRLNPIDREEAVAGFVNDLCRVLGHLFDPANGYRSGTVTRALNTLIESAKRHEFPPLPELKKGVAWTLFYMQWHGEVRPLTAEEIRTSDAAWRLSDALHRPRPNSRLNWRTYERPSNID